MPWARLGSERSSGHRPADIALHIPEPAGRRLSAGQRSQIFLRGGLGLPRGPHQWERRMQQDESPLSCACRGRVCVMLCEIITVGAPVGPRGSVRQQQIWRRRMKGDLAQNGFLRRGMCVLSPGRLHPGQRIDITLYCYCYDVAGRGPCNSILRALIRPGA